MAQEQISFISGLAGGLAQGKHEQRKMALLEQDKADRKTLLDMQIKKMKADNEIENIKSGILARMTPEQQMAALFPKADDSLESKLLAIEKFMGGGAGPQQVPLPEYSPGEGMPPYRPGTSMSIPEQVAAGQMGAMGGLGLTREDLVRGVIKKELGAEPTTYHRTATVADPDTGLPMVVPMDMMGNLDMSKARPAPIKPDMQPGVGEGMAPVQTPVNPYNREPMGPTVQTGPPPTMQVERPTPGGGKVRGVVPLFPGGSSRVTGTTTGGFRTELDLMDVPMQADDVTKWTDGQGKNPPPGWTPRQAQGRGFVPAKKEMAAETGGKVVMIAQAIQDIEAAEKLLFPAPGQFNRKLAFGAQANIPEWMVENAQIVESAIQNAISAKLRIETGAQANPSEVVNIAKRFYPSGVKDSEKSARNKLNRLKQFMKDGKVVMDPQGRIVIVEPPKAKPGLSLGDKKDPSSMTNDELLKALR